MTKLEKKLPNGQNSILENQQISSKKMHFWPIFAILLTQVVNFHVENTLFK